MEPICGSVSVQLIGEDGNAFSILAKVLRAMRSAKVPLETINAFQTEAMSGDYNNLLRVCMKYVEVY